MAACVSARQGTAKIPPAASRTPAQMLEHRSGVGGRELAVGGRLKLQPGVQGRDRRRQRAQGRGLGELVERRVLATVAQEQHGLAGGRFDADPRRGGPEPLVRGLEPRAMPPHRTVLVFAVGGFPDDAAMPSTGLEKEQSGVVWAGFRARAGRLGPRGRRSHLGGRGKICLFGSAATCNS